MKIQIARKFGGPVVTYSYGTLRPGRYARTIKAPGRRGNYTLS